MTGYDGAGLKAVLEQPTARCFPVGSPYLMPSERFTRNNTLTHSGSGNQFSTPWGSSSATPAGGWYGGSDTTFTGLLKSCTIQANGSCQGGTIGTIAALRPFGGTLGASQLADSAMRRYLWPLRSPYNGSSANKALVNVRVASGDTLYLSGVLRGRLTMRVDGGVVLPDRLRYAQDPNDPNTIPCENTLGLLAIRDILVGHGAAARIYDVGSGVSNFTLRGGGEARFTIHGFLMSLTGSVGVLGNNLNFGATSGAASQLSCPEDETTSKDDSNGGCFAITGGVAMRTYRPFYVSTGGGSTKNGMRYSGTWDRCSESGGRPPYYPVTTRVFVVRTLEVGASRANTPARVETYLRSLLGKPL
jgi:hypothetical protein